MQVVVNVADIHVELDNNNSAGEGNECVNDIRLLPANHGTEFLIQQQDHDENIVAMVEQMILEYAEVFDGRRNQ